MPSLREFARNIEIIADGVPINAAAAVRELALDIERRLVLSTPVDTGQARSNWLVGVNAPRRDRRSPVPPAAAIATAAAALASTRSEDVVFMSNNLPYIVSLNRGKSRQAPAGYVQRDVNAAVRAQRGRIDLLRRTRGRR